MMNKLRTSKYVWALAIVATVMGGSTSAQQATSTPGVVQAQTSERYTVGQAKPPATAGMTLIDMSLDAAMAMALEKNLDLKVARMNPQGVDYQLAAARAAFRPTITSSYTYRDSTAAPNNTLEKSTTSTVTQGYNGGGSMTLPWYGATASMSFTNGRTATDSIQTVLNPSYSSGLAFTYSQPLLQGFKIDNTRNQLRTLQITRQVADLTLLAAIENTKASVRTAYWNLRQAIEQIEIQRRSLDLAKRLWDDNRVKVEIGTLAPIDTVTPEAQVATAEQALLNAEIGWTTADLTLKRLLASGPEDDLYKQTINPTETPSLSIATVDISAAVQRALADRTDIVTTRRNIESSQLTLEVTKEALKPSLALNGGYNASGTGGPRLTAGVVTTPGGYSDALGKVFTFELPTWNFGFNFTYPLGLVAGRANYARAVLQLEQSQASLKASELTISSDVTNAGRAVENTYKQYQAAQKSREAQERNAEAAQTRFDVGMSTNYEVVQAQNNLTTARLTELNRLIAYLNAIAEFDRIQRVGR